MTIVAGVVAGLTVGAAVCLTVRDVHRRVRLAVIPVRVNRKDHR